MVSMLVTSEFTTSSSTYTLTFIPNYKCTSEFCCVSAHSTIHGHHTRFEPVSVYSFPYKRI